MASFNFSFQPGTSIEQMIGFEMAGLIWSKFIKDDISVNIHVALSSGLDASVAGTSIPRFIEQSYQNTQVLLALDKTSANDTTAIANLNGKGSAQYQALVGSQTVTGDQIRLTSANAKALGVAPQDAALDGYILLNSFQGSALAWNYDYTRSTSANPKSLDFLSVALHEVGHILGFISDIDQSAKSINIGSNSPATLSPLDLFRYSDRSVSSSAIEFSSGASAYFSIDGGKTNLAPFASGLTTSPGGTVGFQASHWASSNPILKLINSNLSASDPSLTQFLNSAAVLSRLEASVATNTPAATSSSNPSTNQPTTIIGGLFGLLLSPLSFILNPLLGNTNSNSGSSIQITPIPDIAPVGIMDPTLALGERASISALDLTAFDVIGYNLGNTALANSNLAIDYATLAMQAQQKLASKLGVPIASLGSSSIQTSQSLTQNRLSETATLLEQAQSYNLRQATRPRGKASYWQENGFQVDALTIVSNGGGDSTELKVAHGSLLATRVEALSHAPLILRTQSLTGGAANDFMVGNGTQPQTVNAGEGDNIVQLGSQGGSVTSGLGQDIIISTGKQLNVQDSGGNNVVIADTAVGGNHTLNLNQGNNYVYTRGQIVAVNTGRGDDMIVGDRSIFDPTAVPTPTPQRSSGGLLGLFSLGGLFGSPAPQPVTPTSQFTISDLGGNNTIVLRGGSNTVHKITTGIGSDRIELQGLSAQVNSGAGNDTLDVNTRTATLTTGLGNDLIVLGNKNGAYFTGQGNNDFAQITDFSLSDRLLLYGTASDYQLNASKLYYRGDLIASFSSPTFFSLTGSQVAYIPPKSSAPLPLGFVPASQTLPSREQILSQSLDRYLQQTSVTYSIVGGVDQNLFTINSETGELQFKTAPNANQPLDANRDNRYDVWVKAVQGNGANSIDNDIQKLSIVVQPQSAIPYSQQVIGTYSSETLWGTPNADRIEGRGGNDILIGGGGNDEIIGTDEMSRGLNEIDQAYGGSGADTYVLGTTQAAYYATGGTNDYMRIHGFEVGVDRVVLHGSAQAYRSEVSGRDTLLYTQTNDLVAIFEGQTQIDLRKFTYS